MKKLFNAINVAANCHKNQKRQDNGEPYINHPLEVMKLVHDFCDADEDVLCAAVLHDVVEDTYYSLDEVKYHFGNTVHYYMNLLTDPPDIHDNKERRKFQIKRLIDEKCVEVNNIKVADKISNCNDLISKYTSRTNKSIAGYFKFSKLLVDKVVCEEKLANQFYLLYDLAKKNKLKGYL